MPWYAIQTPEMADQEMAMSFCGEKHPSDSAGKVWMCAPGGRRVLEVESKYVKDLTPKELVKLIQEDAKWRKRGNN